MFSFSHHSDIKPCLLKYAEFRWNSPEKNIVVSVFVCFRSVRWASDRRPSTRTYNLLCFFGDDSACTGVETIVRVKPVACVYGWCMYGVRWWVVCRRAATTSTDVTRGQRQLRGGETLRRCATRIGARFRRQGTTRWRWRHELTSLVA